ncbi:MAG: hypothetical protein Q8927_18935 [Bacteroidota bacterium]|nr:hypothetical protein [Bacteroidota bacterium]MDP4218282.1 hypothetical protein [Bacteroidota bacterium]MDP4248311.1 hypothetical protein [Bacteroidota bacterium]MDP4253616.1 hypothetical protein [Bacteroidota bacterium]MDP4258282.1 hypothetical protein [Bacteroidota bacterium]
MRKTILALAAILMIGLSAFAVKGGDLNERARAAFSKDFSTAKNAVWQYTENLAKVTFTFNDQVLTAFYDPNGDLQAIARNILSTQLPLNLLAELKNNYNGYWISDLFEMAADDQTTYYISLENANRTIVLKSEGTEGWRVFSKIKKDEE